MNEWLVIGISILFSAFFSGMEIAFVAANRMQLEVDKQKNDLTAGILNIFTTNPQQYIATMLVGNNLVLVIYGLVFAKLLEPWVNSMFEPRILVLLAQTLIASLLILITGEFIPKKIFKTYPNGLLKIFAVPVLFFYLLLWPIAWLTFNMSKQFLSKVLKKNMSTENEDMLFSRHDLDNFVNQNDAVQQHPSLDEDTELKLFKNALDFTKVKVRDCMIPRAEIEAIDENAPIEEIRQRFVETGFSKILIYSNSIDNIYGYVHSSKIFSYPSTIKAVTNTITIVPETLPANKLLGIFSQKHKSIALVVDEFGGTSGLVTTEDILEEIFGEIEDEHDIDNLTAKQVTESEWILSARFEISALNEKYGFGLPENEQYDTLAGLILNQHESIPKVNTLIECEQFQFRVLKATRTKIELVLMKLNELEKKN